MAILILEEPRKHKYNAKAEVVDGICFDSKQEARHYMELKIRERIGEISSLEVHVAFRLEINGVLIGHYYADFVYRENGKRIVADSKGNKTPVYQLKKKLMKALHQIDILEM